MEEIYISGKGLVPVILSLPRNSSEGRVVGVEIGVCRGENMRYLLEHCPNINMMWGIDPFMAYHDGVGNGGQDQAMCDDFQAKAIKNLLPYTEGSRAVLVFNPSSVEASKFKPGSISFVYVDGNHSPEYVLQDFRLWYPNVASGGLFSGHDFGVHGVQVALKTFTREIGIPWDKVIEVENSAWYFWKP
jgi:hypothetical protein